jgi:plastocyanin
MNTPKRFSRWAGRTVGVMLFAHSLAGVAATVTVFVGNTNAFGNAADVFVPATNNINVNDQVVWVWEGNMHSSTSGAATTNSIMPNGLWDSGITNPPHSFTNKFAAAGSFPYFCLNHFNKGMIGLINVAAADVPPTISITNPPDGANLSAPASITLAATASDADGTVTNVQFFQGATSLGNMATSPYSVPVNNLAAADYTFSAVATDNAGLTATNAITIHVVTALPIVLSAPQFLSSTDFRFDYTANPGLSYIIQRAPDLSSGIWTTLSTNVATGSPMLFDDTAVSGSPAFYRVGLLPNP